ncbi:MAG TPA: NusG domain II-containing protein [Thauera sp.]|nr:NusG domain II-containing protein [Thauera sp.]
MRFSVAAWRALIKPGDVLVVLVGLVVCVHSLLLLWRGGQPEAAIVRAGGKVVAELDLSTPRMLEVPGPLGTTRIEIQPGRARVAADPGPRQYCVRQGWLTQAGAVAICAPNEVSLSLSGRGADYDSLNY